MRTLTLLDYSDRELLHIVDEERGDDGWTRTQDVAIRVGLTGKKRNNPAGIRLAWMRRYGAVERDPKRGLWKLTAIGRQLMDGELSEIDQQMLASMDPSQLLMLTRELTGRWRKTGATASTLIRREWQRGTTRRRS